MSDLSARLAEYQPILRSTAVYAAWSASFIISTAINLEPVYFLVLLLVLATDVIEPSDKSKGLFRDFVAGALTALLSLSLNDQLGLAVGGMVAVVALASLLRKLT